MVWNEQDHPRKKNGRFTFKGKLVYDTEEARELYERITSGDYLSIHELRNHQVVKMLDEKAKEAYEKYGNTSLIQSSARIKAREQWEKNFLSSGSMIRDGQDENGYPQYKSGGPVRRGFKAIIAIGLPAAGKSTMVANPASADLGAFVFDSDEIKKEIPEFRESMGSAASAVHKESKAIQQSAFSKFLEGGDRQGDNLVIPIIGDDEGRLYDNYIEKLESAGYDVEIRYQDADPVASMNRSTARAIKTGRIIPSEELFKYEDKPFYVFESYKKKTNRKGNPYVRT